MSRKLLPLLFLLPFTNAWSQNPATVFDIPNRNVTLACGTTCTSITATVPHIKQTNDYLITSIPYLPFAYATPTGNEVTDIYTDDTWSEKLPIGFPFCFYGITYPTLVMGSNSIVSFDSSRAGLGSGYAIEFTTTIPYGTSANLFAPASIFGPYHDINPSVSNNPAPTNRKIEWRVEGVAPKRRFIASYNEVKYFGTNCNTFFATHQMVMYESTGIIEVYIKDKPVCTDWNDGLAILGIQDETRTKAVAAAGKNATTWGTTGMNEAYRFTPNGATPRFRRAELIDNGTVIALADTASGNPGLLNLNFPNVCPTQDSTAYVLRVIYGVCNDPSQDVSFDDTIYIKRPTPTLSLTSQDAVCTTGGVITANVTSNIGGNFEYSINGGTPQTSNVFSNLAPGTYTVAVQGAGSGGGCAVVQQATISLVNNLTVSASPSDTSICVGASFVPRVQSNSTNFTWTPSAGVSSPTALQPTLTPGNLNTQFIITATEGVCQVKDTISVTVFQGQPANAGPDLSVLLGDQVQLQATGAPGATYLWTPSAGLSATNILTPMASPVQTTTYTLTATTTQGCVSSDDVTVTVLSCVDPMNAFSPNGDGLNDFWLVTNNNCFKTAKVEVFNRYGGKVFEDPNYANNWNGTFKGKPLPDGTYYYVVTYQLINGKNVYKKGNVTILR